MAEFTIRPLKNAAGEFTGGMNFDPELLKFGEIKPGRNNMKFINLLYDGKRIKVETPEMNIPAGVVQFPSPDKVTPGEKVSYTLLMSFDGVESRPDLRAYMDFLKTVEQKVLEMVHARSSDIYDTLRDESFLAGIQTKMVKKGVKTYADSTAIGLPYTAGDGEHGLAPQFITYDFSKIERGTPPQDAVVHDIRQMTTKRGSVKVIFPLSSVWTARNGFGIAMKASDVLVRESSAAGGFGFDVTVKKATEDEGRLVEDSGDEDDYGLGGLGLDADE
jgi:hypothetical protein